MTGASPHVIVLPGGGYEQHAAHEAEPIARWLGGLGVAASVFRYPLKVRHPAPLNALRAEVRRLRDGGSTRIGVIGFAGLVARSREPGFAERYERFLTAGGSASPAELMAVVGVDLGDPEIWNDGFAVLEGFVERMR